MDFYDNFRQPSLPPAEDRLETDAILGFLNYPDGDERDQYFRQGFALNRTVHQPQKVRKVITSYLNYAKDPALRADLQQFLDELGEQK